MASGAFCTEWDCCSRPCSNVSGGRSSNSAGRGRPSWSDRPFIADVLAWIALVEAEEPDARCAQGSRQLCRHRTTKELAHHGQHRRMLDHHRRASPVLAQKAALSPEILTIEANPLTKASRLVAYSPSVAVPATGIVKRTSARGAFAAALGLLSKSNEMEENLKVGVELGVEDFVPLVSALGRAA